MKRIVYTIFVLLYLSSCTKKTSPGPASPLVPPVTVLPPVVPPVVIPVSLVTSYSVRISSNNTLTTDTIRYDDKNNIRSITHQYINDVGPNQTLDSGTYYFTMNNSQTRPSGYTLIYRKYYYTDAVTENHILSYDDSNRVVLDSMISTTSTTENIKGIHYAYFPDTVVLRLYQVGQFDFMDSILSSGGNFDYFSESNPDGTGWSNFISYKRGVLTNYGNPFYTAGLSKSLGAFYIIADNMDFLSKNLTTLDGFFYTWNTDSKGRILTVMAPDGSFVKFTYK